MASTSFTDFIILYARFKHTAIIEVTILLLFTTRTQHDEASTTHTKKNMYSLNATADLLHRMHKKKSLTPSARNMYFRNADFFCLTRLNVEQLWHKREAVSGVTVSEKIGLLALQYRLFRVCCKKSVVPTKNYRLSHFLNGKTEKVGTTDNSTTFFQHALSILLVLHPLSTSTYIFVVRSDHWGLVFVYLLCCSVLGVGVCYLG